MVRYLITGGCGFIGRNLISRLATDPANHIRVFDDLSVGSIAELQTVIPVLRRGEGKEPCFVRGAAELIVGDIRDAPAITAAMAGAEIVVHLAANSGVALAVADPERDCGVNVLGTLNCLQAARLQAARRFVFASSGAPLGMCEPPLHEAMAPRPASPYGASKLAGEAYCCAYFHCFGVETVVLRFANVYGPYSGHKSSVVAKLIREALRGEAWTLYGDGGQTRDFIFVDDLCSAIAKAALTPGVVGMSSRSPPTPRRAWSISPNACAPRFAGVESSRRPPSSARCRGATFCAISRTSKRPPRAWVGAPASISMRVWR